ncbi:MAG: TlpA disulfide reductase family protein, partial [Gemmatimonadota bacterium]|nr:TlpA disulfide reductase family protein [Gemmatimonadota bacterium]
MTEGQRISGSAGQWVGGSVSQRVGGSAGRSIGRSAGRLAAILLPLCLAAPLPILHAQGGLPIGTLVSPVVVPDLDDQPFDFATVLGRKPVVVQFWATWCSICEALMPTMRAAKAQYGDRVEFIGVNVTVNQTPARVRRYLEEHSPPFRNLYDKRGLAVRAFEAPATGFITIVGADGKVAYTGSGERQDIVAALGRIV